jgi:hypothetical protein
MCKHIMICYLLISPTTHIYLLESSFTLSHTHLQLIINPLAHLERTKISIKIIIKSLYELRLADTTTFELMFV